MKRLILIFLCCLTLTIFSNAQDTIIEKEQSNLEVFAARPGTLIEKTYINIGKMRNINVHVLNLTDLMENTKISGVRLETDFVRGSSRPQVAFLDKDEIDPLIKAIGIIKNKILATRPENYTEIVFTSRSGFTTGSYMAEGKWRIFMKFDPLGSDSSVYFQFDELDWIVSLLEQAKQKL